MAAGFTAHFIKYFLRRENLDTSMVWKILAGFTVVYVLLMTYNFSYHFEKLLQEFFPELHPIACFHYLLIYLLSIDFVIRLFLQNKPLQITKAYLHLPVSKHEIILYNLISQVFSYNNLFFLILIIPFSINTLLPTIGIISFLVYSTEMLLILIFLSFFALMVKLLINKSVIFYLIPSAWLVLLFSLSLPLKPATDSYFLQLLANLMDERYLIFTFMIVVNLILFILNYYLIKDYMYQIYLNEKRFRRPGILGALFDQITAYNPYINYEINLFTRNKRIRSILLISILALILTIYIICLNRIHDLPALFYWFICLSGLPGYTYAQYMFSWESNHFDLLSAAPYDMNKSLRVKYLICCIASLIILVVLLPLIIMYQLNLHTVLSAVLYNIGIGYSIAFYTATYNKHKLDINASAFFNLQSNNNLQTLSICLIIAVPAILMLILIPIISSPIFFFLLNAISLLFLFQYKIGIKLIIKKFARRKYTNLEGYRK
jgi:hypothetical protein